MSDGKSASPDLTRLRKVLISVRGASATRISNQLRKSSAVFSPGHPHRGQRFGTERREHVVLVRMALAIVYPLGSHFLLSAQPRQYRIDTALANVEARPIQQLQQLQPIPGSLFEERQHCQL